MKVLVVIDMQNDFIDGPLGSLDAQAIVHRVVDKIAAHDGPLLATQDSHDLSYLDTQEGKRLPVPHCLLHSDGWQLAEPIRRAFEERAAHRTRHGIEPKVVRPPSAPRSSPRRWWSWTGRRGSTRSSSSVSVRTSA